MIERCTMCEQPIARAVPLPEEVEAHAKDLRDWADFVEDDRMSPNAGKELRESAGLLESLARRVASHEARERELNAILGGDNHETLVHAAANAVSRVAELESKLAVSEARREKLEAVTKAAVEFRAHYGQTWAHDALGSALLALETK